MTELQDVNTITQDLVNAIRELFIVREDCFAMQKENLNEYTVVKGLFSDQIIKSHLRGTIIVGSFQINPKNNTVKWICFDFDGDLDTELKKAKSLYKKLLRENFNPLLEFSGRRGYHVWLFVEQVDAGIAKNFARSISKDIEIGDIFPKQNMITETQFGGQVKIPLGIHRASKNRSFLFDDKFESLTWDESIQKLIYVSQNRDKLIPQNVKSLDG